jgi:hypothetical protein
LNHSTGRLSIHIVGRPSQTAVFLCRPPAPHEGNGGSASAAWFSAQGSSGPIHFLCAEAVRTLCMW